MASTFATATGEYEKAFWTNIYTKLLPLQVAGDKDSPLSVIHRIERIIVKHHTLPDDRALLPPTFQNDVMAQREASSAELPASKSPATLGTGRF